MNMFYTSIAELEQLESLMLSTELIYEYDPYLQLQGLSQLHRLKKLYLSGWIEILPVPQEFPRNIYHLTLDHSLIYENLMCVLKQLPKLSILILRMNYYTGNQMAISAGGFPLLKFLELEPLIDLTVLTMEDVAMPRQTLPHFTLPISKGASRWNNFSKLSSGVGDLLHAN